jgi:putative transposase
MSPKTSSERDVYELSTEIALFRYGLIAQLIHDPPAQGQQEAQLRALAAKTYQLPGSRRTRVSLSALRRYLKAYRTGGFDALRPVGRPDAGVPRAFPPEVLAKAIALRLAQPARTTQTLVELLQRDPTVQLSQPLNAHTLTTHLRRRGQTRRLLRQDPKTFRRFERAQVNELWQGDAMTGPWLPDPQAPGKKRRTHLFCFIDDHSRLVPYAEFFFDEALPRMERVLKVGILRRGLPRALYVDNGQVYSATQFAAACATLAIQRIQASPYAPEGKGKQERFFETLRLQFLPEAETSDLTTLSTLNESLCAWLECLYHQRVHSETEQSPLARYSAGLDQVRPVDPETLRRAFLWRQQRKVQRDATLSLQGNRYQVDPRWAGRTLELRFDPFDLSHIELLLEGQPLGLATIVSQQRQRHLAVARLASEPPEPPKPQSSLDFLAVLRAEYRAQQQQQLGRLEFARLSPPTPKEH